MDEQAARIENRIEARQRAWREACPPPLRPAFERLQTTQAEAGTVFREVSGRLMERRRLRTERDRETDEARREPIQKRIAALDDELAPVDEDRRRASERVAVVAREWEDAKRTYRVAPVPEPRRAEALALLEEERQALLRLAREHRAGARRHEESVLVDPLIEAHLFFARRDGDEKAIARLTALSETATGAAAQLDAGTLAFRERVAEVQADTERRLRELAGAGE